MGKITHNEMTKQNARTAIFTLSERTLETEKGGNHECSQTLHCIYYIQYFCKSYNTQQKQWASLIIFYCYLNFIAVLMAGKRKSKMWQMSSWLVVKYYVIIWEKIITNEDAIQAVLFINSELNGSICKLASTQTALTCDSKGIIHLLCILHFGQPVCEAFRDGTVCRTTAFQKRSEPN